MVSPCVSLPLSLSLTYLLSWPFLHFSFSFFCASIWFSFFFQLNGFRVIFPCLAKLCWLLQSSGKKNPVFFVNFTKKKKQKKPNKKPDLKWHVFEIRNTMKRRLHVFWQALQERLQENLKLSPPVKIQKKKVWLPSLKNRFVLIRQFKQFFCCCYSG